MKESNTSLLLVLLLLLSNSIHMSNSHPTSSLVIKCLLTNSLPTHPISSSILTPQHITYSTVLHSNIKNLRFNTSTTPKPLFIVTATHESHVQASVLCAKANKNLRLVIRSGGHDYEGLSYVSNVPFFVLDMFKLSSIDIDIKTETAWVETGATLGELYYKIQEKSKNHGFPAGVCPTVGVGGHFSGGGFGNLMRKYGLTIDNIVDAKLVDVNGIVLDRASMGEDLFWGIRGGGGASFGVIISFKIKLVRVPNVVSVFRVEKSSSENATEIVYAWQNVVHKLPSELFIRLNLDVVQDTFRATFIGFFLGSSKNLLSTTNERFPELGLARSDVIETTWIKSLLYWAEFPIGTPEKVLLDRRSQSLNSVKIKSDYIKRPISKKGLNFIFEKMIKLRVPYMSFDPHGGKMAEISSGDTPYPHRAGNLWKIQYLAMWEEEGSEIANRNIELVRRLHSYMTPFVSKNPREAYLNFRDLDLGINHNAEMSYWEGRAYGVKYFKGNFDRLVNIKTEVDPENFFRYEQSIPVLPVSKKHVNYW